MTFIGNSASNTGGGVSAGSTSNVNICGNATFIGNSASNNGGGVYAGPNSSVMISGKSCFSSNSAIHGGGGIFFESSLTLEGNANFKLLSI